jgi:hypothetical protein
MIRGDSEDKKTGASEIVHGATPEVSSEIRIHDAGLKSNPAMHNVRSTD